MEKALRCPACASTPGDFPVVDRIGTYALRRCSACGLVFSDPMRSADASWYARTYEVKHLAIDDRVMWYFPWALARLAPGGAILDVGCGPGNFVAFARGKGFDAHGIDFSANAIAAGRRRFRLDTLHVGSFEDLGRARPGLRFDGITFFEVLEHVEDPAAVLRAALPYLKPDGRIVAGVPNESRWPVRDFADYPPNHLTRWTPRALGSLFEAAGLEVVEEGRTPRLYSLLYFYGYLPRVVLYRCLGLHRKGLGEEPDGTERRGGGGAIGDGRRGEPWAEPVPAGWRAKVLGGAGSRLRRLRDACMWVPAAATYPILFPFFGGYNLLAIGRRRGAGS